MALSKENSAVKAQLEGCSSESVEPNEDSVDQLEALLNLLIDLKIIQPSENPLFESPLSNNDSNGKAEESIGLASLPIQLSDLESSPEILLSFSQQELVNLDASIEGLKSLLFSPPSPKESAEVTMPVQPETADVDASIEALKNWLSYAQTPEKSAEPTMPAPPDAIIEPLENQLSESAELKEAGLLMPVQPNLSALDATLDKWQERLNQHQQLENPAEETPVSIEDLHELVNPLESLQTLLFGSQLADIEEVKKVITESELPVFRRLITTLEYKLGNLEHQIYDPQELIKLLLPWIVNLLSLKISESKEEVIQAIVPIIDEVIKSKTQQDKPGMSAAIADLLPEAISQQITNAPDEIAKAIAPEIAIAIREQIKLDQDAIAQAIAPEMGRAIKQQIRLEKDAMVDALYPVIGNTITRYLAEAIRSINEKIGNAFSVDGVKRKFRAKLQGVSEAELILKEAMPFTVQAIFLIHKDSGLVISGVQHSGNQRLESEMVGGMLTAIRSFVNDCIVQSGEVSELNEIEYGDSQIVLEVAGYCYLAVVIKGEPPKKLIKKIRQTLSTIILYHGKPIEFYEGDPDTIPEPVQALLEGLMESFSKEKQKENPPVLIGISLAVLSLVILPLGIYHYRHKIEQRIETETASALASTPELAVYRLNVDIDGGNLKLTGKLPNQELREKAAQIAQAAAPAVKLDNKIIAVDVPPDPLLISAEIKRVTAVLNQMEGVSIVTEYADRKVTVEGTVMQMADAQKITQAMKQIPGVQSVISTVRLNSLKIASRIYFDGGSAELNPTYLKTIIQVKEFLEQHPQKHLRIIGHSDSTGNQTKNQQLALQRAKVVKDALVKQGIDPKRLQLVGSLKLPQDVEPNQPLLLSRCIVFEPITPSPKLP